ncbi:MAG: hypothetical protein LBH44_02690 [Treponema sp.]|jgi:chromosome segregation ATPase|nr:hypothetical protein [Treponema sp.]
MTNNSEVAFDPDSGISVEEQKEILAKINGIAEKNRRSLQGTSSLAEAGGKLAFNAKKTGGLFPILVNIAAVVILAGGCLLLFSFNGRKDIKIREGRGAYNPAERALIDEIRKETALKISAKEREIAAIRSQLDEIDAQLAQLYSGNQELTNEQLSAQARLLSMQSTYRNELASSQEERARILEESRSKEAGLRAQLDAGIRERQNSDAELNAALAELNRLSIEHDKVAAIEAQISGGIAAANDLIQQGQFEQAAGIVKDMRLLLNTGAFQSAGAGKKEFYTQTIGSVESMIGALLKNSGSPASAAGITAGGDDLAELRAKNAQLEETIAELQKTIAAFSSDSSGQTRRLTELEATVSSLRAAISSLEAAVAEKDRIIHSLEADKNALTQTVAARDASIRELQSNNSAMTQDISNLNNQINNIRQMLNQ